MHLADGRVRRIVIVGGGTAGWMSAAMLARAFGERDELPEISLVESDVLGTIGVGEATLPPLRQFNQTIGLDEDDFIKATGATAKLGIEFQDWSAPGSRYFHGFGDYGPNVRGQPFRQTLFRLKSEGLIDSLDPWSMAAEIARAGRFARPEADARSVLSSYAYAYHLDAGLYAGCLRRHAEKNGVTRHEGMIVDTRRDDRGLVEAVILKDGSSIAGDLFIDCSGMRALLIAGAMDVGYDDWSRWLPCDRAIALPSQAMTAPAAFTTASAREAGWRWRIPLQHRVGNGYVYSSAFVDDQRALDDLLSQMGSAPTADPNRIRFTAGRRREAWRGNVVAIGLSAGFLEPLESTSIGLIQTGIGRLLDLFPDREFDPVLIKTYNLRTAREVERIRDFIVLHYHKAGRTEGELWKYCRTTEPPDSLAEKIELFETRGEVAMTADDSFREDSWSAVFTGLGVWPVKVSPLVRSTPADAAMQQAEGFAALIRKAAASLPLHEQFLIRRRFSEMNPDVA